MINLAKQAISITKNLAIMARKKNYNNKPQGLDQINNSLIIIRKATMLEIVKAVPIQKKARRRENRIKRKTCRMKEESNSDK